MSKGSKAVCMRLPEPYWGKVEAEARARGISPADFCRRIIVESIQPVEGGKVIGQVTPIPTTSASVYPGGSPSIVTPTPSPVTLSQKIEEAIAAGTAAAVLAKMRAEFPELSPPTETMMHTRENLAKLAKEHPEAVGEFLAKERAKGKMSDREIAEFLEQLGV